MTTFLNLPLELRNYVYDILLHETIEPQFRGVMVVKETYVQRDVPLRCYRGLFGTCRQIYHEVKQAIKHMSATKQLNYELAVTFSHGRPFYSLTWKHFPALSPTVNHMVIDIGLQTHEPFESSGTMRIPHEQELTNLLDHSPESFAWQLFDYIAVLLKALANLLASGDPNFGVLFIEMITLNLKTPIRAYAHNRLHDPMGQRTRVRVNEEEEEKIHDAMQQTLKATSQGFQGFDAKDCHRLSPLIQVGALRFATEGKLWGEGYNLVLAHDDFQWLRYL